jgi:tRNA nucleotidyltransferase (CCA-adding enzyme)
MNLARQMQRYLPEAFLELVNNITQEIAQPTESVYLVGGVVRDMLLGDYLLHPGLRFDLDLVVEGDAVRLAQRVAETTEARLVIHHRFGTAKLRHERFILDLATARRETYTQSGALPTVTPGNIKDDLARRDFSINAMAISLGLEDYGELVDPHQGRSDLERHLIRILHPHSFRDDATRILRAARYEQRLGFQIEAQTAQLLQRDLPMLDTISSDRIRHELQRILEEERPELIIKRLADLGVLSRIDRSLKGDGWIALKFDLARRLNKPTQLPSLYFCLLVYSLNQRALEQFLSRLNTPTRLSRAMRDTLSLKARLSPLDNPSLKPSQIYSQLRQYNVLAIQANAIASDSSIIRCHLHLFVTKLRYVRTSLNGEELKRLGIPVGPELGRVLQALHRAKLDGEVKTKDDEMKLARSVTKARKVTEGEFSKMPRRGKRPSDT